MRVLMKDGRSFCGPLWTWRPQEGWFELVDEEGVNGGKLIHIALVDVAFATERNERTHPPWTGEGRCARCSRDYCDGTEDVDMVEKAKKDGWK